MLSSRVETRVKVPKESKPANGQLDVTLDAPEDQTRVYMTASRVHCNIAFGELAYNVPSAHAAKTVAVLVDMLRDIPFFDFEPSLAWEGASYPRSWIIQSFADASWLSCGRSRLGSSGPIGVFYCIGHFEIDSRASGVQEHGDGCHCSPLLIYCEAT